MNIFNKIKKFFSKKNVEHLTSEQQKVKDFVENVRKNYSGIIKEVVQDCDPNISSFNFTKSAFYDKKWDDIVCKARGLFIDTKNWRVVARGFNKFFNIDERPETNHTNILKTFLSGRIKAYVKYNGYLGIYSYDEYNCCSYFCQKSRLISGIENVNFDKNDPAWYAKNFSKIYHDSLNHRQYDGIREFCIANNCSAIFEVIDNENDPHIIEHTNKKIVLLAYVKNSLDYEEIDIPESHIEHLNENGIMTAKCVRTFEWYDNINFETDVFTIPGFTNMYSNIFKNLNPDVEPFIEGIILVDENYNRVKIKSEYYNFWKNIRTALKKYNKFVTDVISGNNSYKYEDLIIKCKEQNLPIFDHIFKNMPSYYNQFLLKGLMIRSLKKEFANLILLNPTKFDFIRYISSNDNFKNFIKFKYYMISKYINREQYNMKGDMALTDDLNVYDDYILCRDTKYLVENFVKHNNI